MHRLFIGISLSALISIHLVRTAGASEHTDARQALDLFDEYRQEILQKDVPVQYFGYVFIPIRASVSNHAGSSKHERRRALSAMLREALVKNLVSMAEKECKDRGIRLRASAPLTLRGGEFQLVFHSQHPNGTVRVYSSQIESLRKKLKESCEP